jgi:RNA polymerase sigma factor (TIGR02999 family)
VSDPIPTPDQTDVTRLLLDLTKGDSNAVNQLMPMVYDELRRIAGAHLRRERPGHTLQSTALVHEAYIRLIDQHNVEWRNRAHFFAIASRMIRRILVDHARGVHAAKRGAGAPKLSLDEALGVPDGRDLDLVALDDAMETLAKIDPDQVRLIELRYFAGLTIEEAAEVMKISPATVSREWNTARAWLLRELVRGGARES